MNTTTYLAEIATGLLTYSVHSALACLVVLIAGRALSRPHDRDLLWKAALVAPLFTAVVSISASWLRIDLALLARRSHLLSLPSRQMFVRVLDDGAGPVVSRQLIDPVTRMMSITALAVAAACVALAAIRFVRRRRMLARALAGRSVVQNINAGFRLSSAQALQSPIALAGAEVCLPSVVLKEFSAEHRETLIAHELAHLERRDPAWFFAVELITALSAFQPLVFVVARAFRRDVELICDEAAVHSTGNRHALVGALAMLAAPFDPRSPVLGAATAYDGSPLVLRATRIASLQPGKRPAGMRRGPVFAVVALVGALCAVPVVSSAPDMSILPEKLDRRLAMERRDGRTVSVDSVVTGNTRRIRMRVQ